jgi:hypothetical protein
MSDKEESESQKEDEQRLRELMRVANTGTDDIAGVVKDDRELRESTIRKDSKPMKAAKRLLEDMEDESFEGEYPSGETTSVVPMASPEMINRNEQTLLRSVFIGGPAPQLPPRRVALDPILQVALAPKQSADQTVNLVDPS